eukprot:sb/3460624/
MYGLAEHCQTSWLNFVSDLEDALLVCDSAAMELAHWSITVPVLIKEHRVRHVHHVDDKVAEYRDGTASVFLLIGDPGSLTKMNNMIERWVDGDTSLVTVVSLLCPSSLRVLCNKESPEDHYQNQLSTLDTIYPNTIFTFTTAPLSSFLFTDHTLITPSASRLFPLTSADLRNLTSWLRSRGDTRTADSSGVGIAMLPTQLAQQIRVLTEEMTSLFDELGLVEDCYSVGCLSRILADQIVSTASRRPARREGEKMSLVIVDRTTDLFGVTSIDPDNAGSLLFNHSSSLFPGSNDVRVELGGLFNKDKLDLCGSLADSKSAIPISTLLSTTSTQLTDDILGSLEGQIQMDPDILETRDLSQILPAADMHSKLSNFPWFQVLAGVEESGKRRDGEIERYLSSTDLSMLWTVYEGGSSGVAQLVNSITTNHTLTALQLCTLTAHLYSLFGRLAETDSVSEEVEVAKLKRRLMELMECPKDKFSTALGVGCAGNAAALLNRVDVVFDRLEALSRERSNFTQLSSLVSEEQSYSSLVQQIISLSLDSTQDLVDVEYRSGGLRDLLKTGLGLFTRAVAKPRPVCPMLVYVVGGEEALRSTCYLAEEGWSCLNVRGSLTLLLSPAWYTRSGLTCTKSRDKLKSRDLYTFTCDLDSLTIKQQSKLQYLVEEVFNHDYDWVFQSPNGGVVGCVKVPETVSSLEDVPSIADSVGSQLLDLKPGSPDSQINTFEVETGSNWITCSVISSPCLVTGRQLCDAIQGHKDGVKFLGLRQMSSESAVSENFCCVLSRDSVFCISLSIVSPSNLLYIPPFKHLHSTLILDFSSSNPLTSRSISLAMVLVVRDTARYLIRPGCTRLLSSIKIVSTASRRPARREGEKMSLVIVDRTTDLFGVTSIDPDNAGSLLFNNSSPLFPGSNDVRVELGGLFNKDKLDLCGSLADSKSAIPISTLLTTTSTQLTEDILGSLEGQIQMDPDILETRDLSQILPAADMHSKLSNFPWFQVLAGVEESGKRRDGEIERYLSSTDLSMLWTVYEGGSSGVAQLVNSITTNHTLTALQLCTLTAHLYSLFGRLADTDSVSEEVEVAKLKRRLMEMMESPKDKFSTVLGAGCAGNAAALLNRVDVVFDRLEALSRERSSFTQLSSLVSEEQSYSSLVQQIISLSLDSTQDLVDVEYRSGGLRDLLKTGLGLFTRAVAKPRPVCPMLVYVVGGEEALRSTCYLAEEGWSCLNVRGSLTLLLSPAWYTRSGLTCTKSRDKLKSRDLYTFTCDLDSLTIKQQSKLQYLVEEVFNHDYDWVFQSPNGGVVGCVKVPETVSSLEDVPSIADSVGSQLLDLKPGSPDSQINTFEVETGSNWITCSVISSPCLVTGRQLCDAIQGHKDGVKFLGLRQMSSESAVSENFCCVLSRDSVFCISLSIVSPSNLLYIPPFKHLHSTLILDFSSSNPLTSRSISLAMVLVVRDTARYLIRPGCTRLLSSIKILGRDYPTDEETNITEHLLKHTDKLLHMRQSHPLQIVKQRIVEHMQAKYLWNNRSPLFSHYDNITPVVSHAQNFDQLLVPSDHVSRRRQENYFINKDKMLRAHMTCHDQDLLRSGLDCFLSTGDVYRRDTIDRTHYPVFHQMDGVRLFSSWELEEFAKDPKSFTHLQDPSEGVDDSIQACHTPEAVKIVEFSLKGTLISLVQSLFGRCQYRWVDATFPFTHPSWELEIYYQDEWLEVLGCGILQQGILNNSAVPSKIGWAFGLGLERLAMAMYNIPDIRLFWSEDERFLTQFKVDNIHRPIKFEPYSNYTARSRDIAFWVPPSFEENDFYDMMRNKMPADTVEDVKLVDQFTNKEGRTSHCYRLTYRAWDRHLSVAEANEIHEGMAKEVEAIGGVVR